MGVDGLLNLVRGIARGIGGVIRRLRGRAEPPPAI